MSIIIVFLLQYLQETVHVRHSPAMIFVSNLNFSSSRRSITIPTSMFMSLNNLGRNYSSIPSNILNFIPPIISIFPSSEISMHAPFIIHFMNLSSQ